MAAALVVALLLVAVGAGALLLWRGLRGRRVDDHPLCRRCGFDLTGLPDGGGRCPECGADVAAPGAVVVGHRERRRGLIALGLLALLVGGTGAWWAASKIDPTPYEPAWLLMWRADGPQSANADAALAELSRRSAGGGMGRSQRDALVALAVRRLNLSPAAWDARWGTLVLAARDAGRLPAATVDLVTERALTLQGDTALAWDPMWGEWVESSREAGLVSDARWRRYAGQAPPPLVLRVRTRSVADADHLPAELEMRHARVSQQSPLELRTVQRAVRLDAGPWTDVPERGGGSQLGTMMLRTKYLQVPFDPGRPLKRGPHHVAVRVEVSVRDGFADDAPTVAGWTDEEGADFTVLDPGEASATPAADPAAEGAVLASIRLGGVRFDESGPGYTLVNLTFEAPPMDLSFDVSLRDAAGREWPLSGVTATAGEHYGTSASGPCEGAIVGPVDVLLRPSTTEAERSVGVVTYWGRPVIFHGLKNSPAAVLNRADYRDPTPAEAMVPGS